MSTQDPAHDVPEDLHEVVEDEVEDEPVRTGSTSVDDVIRAVEELEDRPIEEHVGVFESAHVQLRRALDDTGQPEEQGDHEAEHPGHA